MSEPTGQAGTAVGPVTPGAVEAKAVGDRLATMRAVQRAIRNKAWGAELPEQAVKALSLWCEQRGIDGTEVEVLGGNIYLNAQFYLRRLAQKIDAGEVEYARADHVEQDPRLLTIATDEKVPEVLREQARYENGRRSLERSIHRLPENAASAVVYRIKLRSMTSEVTGAKAAGNYRGKNAKGGWKDPVGEEFPTETAETRAARRACRQIIDRFPDLKAQMVVIEAEAKVVGQTIVHEIAASREALKALPPSALTHRSVSGLGGYADEYIMGPGDASGAVGNTPAAAVGNPVPVEPVGEEEEDAAIDQRLAAEEEH